MFTRCSHCGTLFRITASALAMAAGDVRCGHCGRVFNALTSLRDDDAPGEPPVAPESPPDLLAATAPQPVPVTPPAEPPPETAAATDSAPPENLEFNAPEQDWAQFFDDAHGIGTDSDERPTVEPEFEVHALQPAQTSEPAAHPADEEAPGTIVRLEEETSDTDAWQAFLRDVPADEEPETPVYVIGAGPPAPEPPQDEAPVVLMEEPPQEEPDSVLSWGSPGGPLAGSPPRHTGWWLAGTGMLILLLAVQAIYMNRDTLASEPRYGETLQGIFGRVGLPLYPSWPLNAYEIRGAEAIAGRTATGALDVVGDIAVTAAHPVGLPLVRIVLRDRWNNIIGSRILRAAEYSAEPSMARTGRVIPGTLIPVQISLADPGPAAQGYEIDVCLPDRYRGLQCQQTHDPFQR